MKTWLVLLCIAAFLLPFFTPVSAQTLPESEAETWLAEQEEQLSLDYGPAEIGNGYTLDILTDPGCVHRSVGRDPATAGPIDVNSQYVSISTSYCRDSNTAFIDIGSRWWGLVGKTQSLTGYIEVLDNFENVVEFIPVTGGNDPESEGALNLHLEWKFPAYGIGYEFRLAINHRMLPDNVGPGTLRSGWYLQSPAFTLNLPLVSTASANCRIQLHIRGQYNVDEYYCFTPQGNAFAMLHFGHSELVALEWVDADHRLLTQLPSGGFCRLTWWDGYKDFITPAFSLQATKWPKDGPAPWLAVEHMVSCQYSEAGTVWRLTVPKIWDP